MCVRRNAQHRELKLSKFTRFALITAVMAAVPTGGPTGCLVSYLPLLSQIKQSHEESLESHTGRPQGETQTTSLALGANREGKNKVEGKASRIQSSRIGSELVCARRDVQHRELKLPKSTRFVCVCVCVCVSIFIKLPITTQSGPVILVILCHSHCPTGGSMILVTKTCVCVYLLNCT